MTDKIQTNDSAVYIRWIDIARTIAISCVVLCHAVDYAHSISDLKNPALNLLFYFCFLFGRLGVPFFLMISGYLLLDREYNDDNIRSFFGKKWCRLLLLTVSWYSIIIVFLTLFNKEVLDPIKIVQELMFVRNVDMPHTWYMGILLALYVLIPFISIILKNFRIRSLIFPLVIFILYTFCFDTANRVLLISFDQNYAMENMFNVGYAGTVYVIYLIMGYVVKKGSFKKIPLSLMIVLLVFGAAGIIMFNVTANYYGGAKYTNIFLLIFSVSAFELLSRIPLKGQRSDGAFDVLRSVAKYSFSIYILHCIVIAVINPMVQSIVDNRILQILILWIFGLIVSYLVSVLLSKIPKVGKFLTYTK